MKNKVLLLYAIFTNIALHGSEQQNQLNYINQINCRKIEQTLSDNYITYARKCLEEYKTANYTPQNMSNIISMGHYITGHSYFPYNCIRDENGDSFIRIAVNKLDLPMIDWQITKYGCHCITQEDFNYCIKQCINQMHPNKTAKNADEKNIAYNILKILIAKQGKNSFYICDLKTKQYREHLIKQLVLLQIKHTKYQSMCPIDKELLEEYTTIDDNDQSPILLKDMYQNITNKKGNTLSHVTVESQNADELYQLMNKNYVSFAPNKAGKTIVDLALDHFQMFTQDVSNVTTLPEKAKLARCCLFMLLQYIKKTDSKALNNEHKCCDKHVITNKK
jgi:hypothetical protein